MSDREMDFDSLVTSAVKRGGSLLIVAGPLRDGGFGVSLRSGVSRVTSELFTLGEVLGEGEGPTATVALARARAAVDGERA